MKITITQLKRIIREEVKRSKRTALRETRSDVPPPRILRNAYDEVYEESGACSIEELEHALACPPGSITADMLYKAGLDVEGDEILGHA